MEGQAQAAAPSPPGAQSTLATRFVQALIIAPLCVAPALVCLHSVTAGDPDVWWHMRTGEWILAHHALPHTDPFSSFAAGKPWQAYSWLFDLLILKCFSRFGLVGINLFTAAMVSAITAASYHLFQRLQSDFAIRIILTCITWRCLTGLYTPRPWLFTIFFFVVEIDILLHARRTGESRELLFLPFLFALWANLHIQFIDGLLVLGIAVGEAVVARWWPATRTRLQMRWIAPIFLACLLAPLLNPYGWEIYKIAHDLASQSGVLQSISELQALGFRSSTDYLILLVTLGAAFALGWHKQLTFFEVVLFAFAVWASFRSRRDIWIIVVITTAILASAVRTHVQQPKKEAGIIAVPVTVLLVALVLSFGSRVMGVNNEVLRTMLATVMPVDAVARIQAAGYPGPLFNDYTWGGYLLWSLRYPVTIDGRAALHGDAHIARSAETWNGEPAWNTDPELNNAKLVVGPVKTPLVQLLRLDPRFQLAYEDKVSAVFIVRANPPGH